MVNQFLQNAVGVSLIIVLLLVFRPLLQRRFRPQTLYAAWLIAIIASLVPLGGTLQPLWTVSPPGARAPIFLETPREASGERLLAAFFPAFTKKLDEIDALYAERRKIDKKTYEFICFALSIKGRSKPCVLKHFKGALDAGATVEELSYIMALTFREAAGADDCWTHDVLSDWKKIVDGQVDCGCVGGKC